MRERKLFTTTPISRIAASVNSAMPACWVNWSFATGARLSPISATIAPVTTGGSRNSITR